MHIKVSPAELSDEPSPIVALTQQPGSPRTPTLLLAVSYGPVLTWALKTRKVHRHYHGGPEMDACAGTSAISGSGQRLNDPSLHYRSVCIGLAASERHSPGLRVLVGTSVDLEAIELRTACVPTPV